MSDTCNAASGVNKFYCAVWRWHFYAGLCMIRFLIMLAAYPAGRLAKISRRRMRRISG